MINDLVGSLAIKESDALILQTKHKGLRKSIVQLYHIKNLCQDWNHIQFT